MTISVNRYEQVGRFPFQCHILEHEDFGMMGEIAVLKWALVCFSRPLPTPNRIACALNDLISPTFSTSVVASGRRLSESCFATTTSRESKGRPDADRV
jgi:Multicopper oxidase